jgi:hypothetical protein
VFECFFVNRIKVSFAAVGAYEGVVVLVLFVGPSVGCVVANDVIYGILFHRASPVKADNSKW